MAIKNQSSEDYLEIILLLKNKLGEVRSIDIVNETGYKKSSISVAMKKLGEREFIEKDNKGYITLTEKGRLLAEKTYEKHCTLKSFFIALGVDKQLAEDDACKIEHQISDETFHKLKEHIHKTIK